MLIMLLSAIQWHVGEIPNFDHLEDFGSLVLYRNASKNARKVLSHFQKNFLGKYENPKFDFGWNVRVPRILKFTNLKLGSFEILSIRNFETLKFCNLEL